MKTITWIGTLCFSALAGSGYGQEFGNDLYLTNAVVMPDGRARVELVAPSNGVYTLLSSRNLTRWDAAMLLDGPTNRFVITSDRPIVQEGLMFVRAAFGQLATYEFLFYFVCSPATLMPGTPAVSFPQSIQVYSVRVDVANSAAWPDQSQVFFTGPPGSGMTNLAAFDATVRPAQNSASYMSPPVADPVIPPPGTWNVTFAGTSLAFSPPTPQAGTRFIVPQPNLMVSNGIITQVSWIYRDASSGQAMAPLPAYVQKVIVQVHGGTPVHRLYTSDGMPPSTTNHVFSQTVNWSDATILSISYYDDLGNCYDAHYSR